MRLLAETPRNRLVGVEAVDAVDAKNSIGRTYSGDGESLKSLVISDQLIPRRARHGACFDVFEMTKVYGSEYYESEFKKASIAGEFDLVLISGHATVGRSFISIDGVDLVISRDLSEGRCRIAYLNACHAGNNTRLLKQCFATMKASYVVAPTAEVPWGNTDNEATRLFV